MGRKRGGGEIAIKKYDLKYAFEVTRAGLFHILGLSIIKPGHL